MKIVRGGPSSQKLSFPKEKHTATGKQETLHAVSQAREAIALENTSTTTSHISVVLDRTLQVHAVKWRS